MRQERGRALGLIFFSSCDLIMTSEQKRKKGGEGGWSGGRGRRARKSLFSLREETIERENILCRRCHDDDVSSPQHPSNSFLFAELEFCMLPLSSARAWLDSSEKKVSVL